MPFSLVPDIRVASVIDIKPEFLRRYGIRLLMLDLDNTLAPYSGAKPEAELLEWKRELESAGISLFIVSNTKADRARDFALRFGVNYIKGAKKPSPLGILRVLTEMGVPADCAALAGDQIFTDVLGANRAGVRSIVVKPLGLKNPLMAIRYVLELPFRLVRRKAEV